MFSSIRRSSAAWAFAIPPTWRCATGTTSPSSVPEDLLAEGVGASHVRALHDGHLRWVRGHGVRFLPVVNWGRARRIPSRKFRSAFPRDVGDRQGSGRNPDRRLAGPCRCKAAAPFTFRHRVEHLSDARTAGSKAARVSMKRPARRSRRAPRTWSWLAAASTATSTGCGRTGIATGARRRASC